jgi:hypothetical protein
LRACGSPSTSLARDYHEAGHAIIVIPLKVSRNVNISLFHLGKGGAATFFDPQLEAVTRKEQDSCHLGRPGG